MSRRSRTDWTTILGGIAQLAIAGGMAYAVHKARESFIDQLLALPTDEAVQFLIQEVPQMNEDAWNTFARHLRPRAEISNYARKLLHFAVEVRKVSLSVDYLLAKSLSQARAILSSTVQDMDEAEWDIFECVLGVRAETSLTARALLNYAVDVRESIEYEADEVLTVDDVLALEDLFRTKIEAALADNVITASEASELERLRQDLNLSPETARRILIEARAAQRSSNTRYALHQRNASREPAQTTRKRRALPGRQPSE